MISRRPFMLCALLGFLAVWPSAGGAEDTVAPGTAVIFVAGERSARSLMMVDPAQSQPVALADLPGADTQPAVGPQGQVAWISHDGKSWDLVEDGRMIADDGDMHLSPAYAPDGTLVAAVSGEAETSLYAFRDGSRVKLVSGGEGGLAVSPAFSPDGRRLAYVSNKDGLGQIYLISIQEGTETKVTATDARATDPAWSPDGQWLAFVLAETDICLIRPDGRDFRQLTRGQGENGHPGFSPDGRMIVFDSNRGGMSQLFVMEIDGGGQRPLLPEFSSPQSLPVWARAAPPPIAPAE